MLTHGKRSYAFQRLRELKKILTVRAIENALGLQPPSFKVWRKVADSPRLVIPRYYGDGTWAEKDTRAVPAVSDIRFCGRLRQETRQHEAFDAGVKAFETIGGGVLSLPCGFGKSTVSLAFAAHLKVRTMIVVHKEFLANQWVDKIKEFCPGATIGRVQGDIFDTEKDFVIALIQTMSQREFSQRAFDTMRVTRSWMRRTISEHLLFLNLCSKFVPSTHLG
jgi:hypothetical protein